MVQQYVGMDRDLNALQGEVLKQQLMLAREMQKYGSEHRIVQKQKLCLDASQKELAQRRKASLAESINLVRTQRKQRWETLTETDKNLSQEVQRIYLKLKTFRAEAAEIKQLIKQHADISGRIKKLRDRIRDSRMISFPHPPRPW